MVSLTPKQNENVEPIKSFISCLVESGKNLSLPLIKDTPDLLKNIS